MINGKKCKKLGFLALISIFTLINPNILIADLSYRVCIENKVTTTHWAHVQIDYTSNCDNSRKTDGPTCQPNEPWCCKKITIANPCDSSNIPTVNFYVDVSSNYTFYIGKYFPPGWLVDGQTDWFTIYSDPKNCYAGNVQGYCYIHNGTTNDLKKK